MAKEPEKPQPPQGKVHIVDVGEVVLKAFGEQQSPAPETKPAEPKPEPAPGAFGGVIPPKGSIASTFRQDDEMVDVMIPRAFMWTGPNHVVYTVPAGPQKLPKRLVEERWFVLNKVTPLKI